MKNKTTVNHYPAAMILLLLLFLLYRHITCIPAVYHALVRFVQRHRGRRAATTVDSVAARGVTVLRYHRVDVIRIAT